MLVLLTARRLKPGTFEQWRHAWEPDEWPEQFSRAYVLRNRNDPDEVISFGLWEGSAEDLRAMADPTDRSRIDRMAAFVESTLIDAEVVEPHRRLTTERSASRIGVLLHAHARGNRDCVKAGGKRPPRASQTSPKYWRTPARAWFGASGDFLSFDEVADVSGLRLRAQC